MAGTRREFFKNMSIGNLNGVYQNLIVSPTSLKPNILRLIDEEIAKGENGRIVMKMNSLTDVDFIEKISKASCAGVKIDLIVRGICCILPGIPGYTENIRVMSIVGRYLEHPRIFCFGTGAEQKIYIGSADMMTRNTEKRVEVACPILDKDIRNQINHYMKVMLSDNVKARVLQSDGTYRKKKASPALHRFPGSIYGGSAARKEGSSGEERDLPSETGRPFSRIKEYTDKIYGEISLHCRKAQCGAGVCKGIEAKN